MAANVSTDSAEGLGRPAEGFGNPPEAFGNSPEGLGLPVSSGSAAAKIASAAKSAPIRTAATAG